MEMWSKSTMCVGARMGTLFIGSPLLHFLFYKLFLLLLFIHFLFCPFFELILNPKFSTVDQFSGESSPVVLPLDENQVITYYTSSRRVEISIDALSNVWHITSFSLFFCLTDNKGIEGCSYWHESWRYIEWPCLFTPLSFGDRNFLTHSFTIHLTFSNGKVVSFVRNSFRRKAKSVDTSFSGIHKRKPKADTRRGSNGFTHILLFISLLLLFCFFFRTTL